MKTRITSAAAFIIISILIGGCCTVHTDKYTEKIYTPVYMKLSDIRSGFKVQSPSDLKNPGKIYVYGKYLFINEKNSGVHIFYNTNPAAPVNVSFIAIPGNVDIAVKNSILYADSYVDLVAVDISDPRNPHLTKRVNEIFPNTLDLNNEYVDPNGGILVNWTSKDTLITYSYKDCGDNYVTSPAYSSKSAVNYGGSLRTTDVNESSSGSSFNNPSPSGVGGSTARFTISSNYLYCVDRTNLITFDLTIASDPKPWDRINIGWNIETIFPYKDKLFIGSTTGMYIYDNSSPLNPYKLCQFSHARSCDPVVADEKYAYVTLRSTSSCAGNMNELDVIDISNIKSPYLIKTYSMLEPYGVGVDGTTVFVCDGKAGLKVFDATKPDDLKLINWQSDITASDIIPLGGTAILIGTDGLYQYDYTNPKNLVFLSKIVIK